MLQISLDENATPEQVKKAISTIGFFVGKGTMVKVLAGLAGDAGHVPAPLAGDSAGGTVSFDVSTRMTDAPPPPPPPPPGVPVLIPTPELDAKGLPWDERIHSGNKSKNQDGSWKARKNVDENTKAAVVAQLRQLYPLPSATVIPPTAGAPPPPPPSAMPEIPAALDRRQPAGDPPPPPAADGALTFREFMAKVTPLLASGKLTQAQLADACKTFDLLNVVQLGLPANAPLIPSVWAYVDTVVNQG